MESLIRFGFLGAFAVVLVPSAGAFATYRSASALIALLEHANLRLPRRLGRALSLVTTWPYVHKVHHSRDVALTDSNYGNLFSCWDRLFGTFTPSDAGTDVRYGLEDFPAAQGAGALLASPWKDARRGGRGAVVELLH